MDIGLQTFTCRRLLHTPDAFDQAFSQLSGMGLRNLELAVDYLPFPFTVETAKMIRAAAERHGLRVRSCQIRYGTSSADIPATIAYMRELGAQILVNSVIDLKLLYMGSLPRYCEMLDELADKLGDITLAHHNHHYEFKRVGDTSALLFMAANSSIRLFVVCGVLPLNRFSVPL